MGRVAHHLGEQRFFVRITDAGEVGDLAGQRLAIKTLRVTLGQRFDRATHVDLDEAGGLRADLVPHVAVG